MNENDMLCSSHQVLDSANGQQVQNHLHPEPYILLGSTSNFVQSHANQVLPPTVSVNNYDIHHLPEHVVRPAFYAMTQYTPLTHPATNQHDLFNVHMDLSSGPRVFPVPLNHRVVDHLPSSSNYGGNVFCSNEGARELSKRKSTEGSLGNFQHFGVSAGPSSSAATPMASYHFHYGLASDAPAPVPDYRGHGLHMAQNRNHYFQGDIGAQSFHPSNIAGLPWNGPPSFSYFQGNNIHGGSTSFLHSPPVQHHNFLPLHNMQDVRGDGVTCYPPFSGAPSRFTSNDGMQHDVSILQHNTEPASRPTGLRIYRSQGRSLGPDAASRQRDLPRLRNLLVDRVALLEFPASYEVDYDVESFIDHHRQMRLDIDDMSYEDLLALSEQIGTVNTGLCEDDITSHLKIRRFKFNAPTINLEDLPCTDQNNESCTICLDEYEDDDELGSLKCGHEYHVDCLKKWLLLKNVCPICKSCALTVGDEKK
ncbi:unnamed protein product [Amaranthus hypochondriacus]